MLAFLLLAFGGWTRLAHIDATLPYPRHVDESALSARAAHLLRTNDYDPKWFHYPSGPMYLTAAGLAVGFVDAARAGELKDAGALGSVSLPYYEHPLVMRAPRRLFAGISLAAMLAVGLLAGRLYGTPWAIPAALAALTCSSLFFEMSWAYLNVDIVGTALAAFAVLAAVRSLDGPPSPKRGFTAGLFAGLAASSKYTHGLSIVAVLAGLGLNRTRQGMVGAAAAASAGAAAGFLCATPYAVLNVRRFVSDLGFDARHYASGHRGFTATPGLPQLATYTSDVLSSFGWLLLPLAVWGLARALATNWRAALVTLAFPAALLALLSSYAVHFERNVLPLHGTYALLVGGGALDLLRWLRDRAVSRWPERTRRPAVVVTLAGLAALLSLAIWQSAIRDQLVVRRDSRNEAVRWMQRNLPVTAMVLVPTELCMHPRTFGRIRWSSVSVTLQPDGNALQVAAEAAGATHVLWPDWGRDLRFAREHELARIRGMAPPGRHLAEFGTRPVLVDYGGGPVPSGDPRLSVVELAEMP